MTLSDHQSSTPTTVLVVEDDLETRAFLVELLDITGYHPLAAASGASGLAAVNAQPVHAILLDLRLPDMDGFAVCSYLRANGHPDLPIILVTADRTPGIEHLARAAGVTTVLAKPFTPDVLLERLRMVLAQS